MNKKSIKNKIIESINNIKNSEEELKLCLGDSVTITDSKSVILLKKEDLNHFKKCTTELQKSIEFLCYSVWGKYCNEHLSYHEGVGELMKNHQVRLEVNGNELDVLLFGFKILGNNSYEVILAEVIEDDKEKYASTYCKDNYLKELGLYYEFSGELNQPLYGHDVAL